MTVLRCAYVKYAPMSPFSTLLHETRVRKNLRQAELARLTERDQTYISALELDAKGPPPREFVERMVKVLQLSDADAAKLLAAAEASDRKLVIDRDAPQAVYWLVHRLRGAIPKLLPAQVRLIDEVLSLHPSREGWPKSGRRIRRRQTQSEGAEM